MLNFEYSTPTKIFFGRGQIDLLGEAIINYGQKILLAYGSGSIKNNGIYQEVVSQLNKYNIEFVELSGIKPNPRIHSVWRGIELCREHQVDFILGVGGGSVIDCIKAISAGVYYDGDPWDFFIGKAKIEQAVPLGTILTLSATGSEMNGNSVISHDEFKLKLATGHELLKPKFSVLDPTFTFSVNKYQTASGTADIMSHCFEQYFSPVKNTYLQDRLTESIITTCIYNGPIAIDRPDDYDARANLMWASSVALNGLLSYGKRGDWATHGIEHALSAHFDLTHGVGLAIITPHWMEYILNEETVDKFVAYAYHVWHIEGNDPYEIARKAIQKTSDFFKSMGIPMSLKETGIELSPGLISQMAQEITMFGPIGQIKKLEEDDVITILKQIL